MKEWCLLLPWGSPAPTTSPPHPEETRRCSSDQQNKSTGEVRSRFSLLYSQRMGAMRAAWQSLRGLQLHPWKGAKRRLKLNGWNFLKDVVKSREPACGVFYSPCQIKIIYLAHSDFFFFKSAFWMMFVQRNQWATPTGHQQTMSNFLQWEKKNRRHKTIPRHRWILIMCGTGLGSECFQIRLCPQCAAKKKKKKKIIIKHFDTFICLLDSSTCHWTCRYVLFTLTAL